MKGVIKIFNEKHRKFFHEALELMKKDRYEEAIEKFTQAKDINPEDHVSWQNMGTCYISLGKKAEAVDCFKKALVIKPEYKMAENNLKLIEDAGELELRRIARFSKYKRREEMADKKNKKFKIKMDTGQYKKLMKLAYLGNWMANAIHVREDQNKDYHETEQFIYSKAKKAGLGYMVDYSKEFGEYFPEFAETPEIENIIDEYDNGNFWDDLVTHLAGRDIAEAYGWEEFQKLDMKEQFKIRGEFEEKYNEEFEKRGLERVKIVK